MKDIPVTAVVAIGNSSRFFSTLDELGYEFKTVEFPDHHIFSNNDLLFNNDVVIVTEKDAVKIRCLDIDKKNLWYMEVEAVVDDLVMERISRALV